MPSLLHASGRFDKSPMWLKRDLIRWREIAGVITLTEVADAERKAALRFPGWTVTSGRGEGAGECAILTHDLRWAVLEHWQKPITAGRGLARLKAPVYATTAVYQRKGTGRLLIVSTAHMPAHVETLLRVGRFLPPASTWKQAARRWARHIATVRKQYPDAEVWIAADWNISAGSKWARRLVRDSFKVAGGDLRVMASKQGTHGGRTIDFALSSMRPDIAMVIQAEASDHDAARFRVEWPLRKRKP